MEFYSYTSNGFIKVDVFDFENGETSFHVNAYHYDTHILRVNIGTSIDEPYASFTTNENIGKFTRTDLHIISLALDFAKKHAPNEQIKARVKAVLEVIKYLNYGKFDLWYSKYEASNGFIFDVSVYNVTEVSKSKPMGKYCAIDDLT